MTALRPQDARRLFLPRGKLFRVRLTRHPLLADNNNPAREYRGEDAMNTIVKIGFWVLIIKTIVLVGLNFDSLFGDTERAEQDREAIQGDWAITYAESNGVPAPPGMFDGGFFVFDDGRIELNGKQGTYHIKPSRGHGKIDITYGERLDRGIYQLEGNRLTVCFHTNGGRPGDFETTPHSYRTMFELARY